MTPDMINGLFEAFGAAMIALHCVATWRARSSAGVSPTACLAFAAWGAWNLFYYPHLDQWWSFAGGVLVFSANIFWVILVFTYRNKTQ